MSGDWTKPLANPDQLLHLVLESLSDCAVFLLDAAGRVTGWNIGAERLFGYTAGEILGQPLSRFFTSEDSERGEPERELRTAAAQGRCCEDRWQIRKDGTRLWAKIDLTAQRNDQGAIQGYARIMRNRTEARLAEDAAEVQKRCFRSQLACIVESSADAIIAKDLDGVIVSWNKGAERLYGYKAEEVIGKRQSILIPPGQADDLPGILERVKGGESIENYDTVRMRKDGVLVDVSLSISPVKDAEGRVVGAAKIARDATARRKAERRQRLLARSGAVLTTALDDKVVLEGLAHLVVPTLADYCLLHLKMDGAAIRQLASAHFDPQKEDLLKEFARIYHPENHPDSRVSRVLRTGRSELYSEYCLAADATMRFPDAVLAVLRRLDPCSFLIVPLTARGKTIGTIMMAASESGRRYDVCDLAFAEELADRVALSVDNAHLYREVREANCRKNEWIATLAHELRNPLAPLLTGLHILRRSAGDRSAVEQTEAMMERQVRHMALLVDDLLDVSRVARGKIQLRRERLDLARLIRTTVADRRHVLTEAGLALTVEAPETPVWMTGDAMRLAQVLGNLLDNAAKFTDRGGRVEVKLAADESKRWADLRVRDSGVGIPPETLPRLFEPFNQADRSLHRTQGGLGLGLALVKGLTELHGGAVNVVSNGPHQGTEFRVTLPLDGEPPVLSEKAEAPAPTRGRLRVLVVEDNRDAADTLRMLLELLGHEVRVAYTGTEGVRIAAEWLPTVVLSDIGLPGMDGFAVARALRRNPPTAKVQLIAITGYGSEQDRKIARESGFDHLLTKPADPGVLQLLLGEAG